MEPNPDARDAVDALAQVVAELREQQRRLDDAVAAARAAGATWGLIGEAAGMTRQAAHERWGHLSRPGCPRVGCGCAEHLPGRGVCRCGHGPGRGGGRRRLGLDT